MGVFLTLQHYLGPIGLFISIDGLGFCFFKPTQSKFGLLVWSFFIGLIQSYTILLIQHMILKNTWSYFNPSRFGLVKLYDPMIRLLILVTLVVTMMVAMVIVGEVCGSDNKNRWWW